MFKRILKVATPIAILFLFSSYSLAKADDTAPKEEVFYYLTDHLGGVDVVTDEDGNAVERKDYLPFGDDRIQPQLDPQPESYGYTGKEQDYETGLYYYGARYYDPQIGRFTQIDPLVLGESEKPLADVLSNPQALNGYTYVLNNPMRYVDEEGLYSEDVHYDLTFYLAIASGLDLGQAKTVAFFDQYTDINPATLPNDLSGAEGVSQTVKNYNEGITNYYHFASRGDALGRIVNALGTGDLSKFGTALHTFQDTYSHAGLTPITHAKQWHDPDMTNLNPAKAMIMARNSFYLLRYLNKNKNGIGDMEESKYFEQTNKMWRLISPNVKKFLEMENKAGHDITTTAAVIKQDATLTKPDDDKKESIKQN
jgi:RHS repeat-associated protein